MSSKYFILSKNENNLVDDNNDNNIVLLNGLTFILPANNIGYYTSNGLFENRLIEWCKQFCDKSQNILDIGAHTGTYSLCLSNHCKNVYAFEPQRMTYYSLCGSVALSNKSNIIPYNYGLGSHVQAGKMPLFVISEDGGGSTIQPIEEDKIIRTEGIEISTLDEFRFTDINFIKLDVENNELDVLKGGINTIINNNFPKILFESNTTNPELFDYITNTLKYKNIIPIRGTNNMFLATTD
jgi:FkbM family methyltransferase